MPFNSTVRFSGNYHLLVSDLHVYIFHVDCSVICYDYYLIVIYTKNRVVMCVTHHSGDRFTKVIINRKAKITLTISLRARIRAFQ